MPGTRNSQPRKTSEVMGHRRESTTVTLLSILRDEGSSHLLSKNFSSQQKKNHYRKPQSIKMERISDRVLSSPCWKFHSLYFNNMAVYTWSGKI